LLVKKLARKFARLAVGSTTPQPIGTVTVSLGVAFWRADETFDEFVARADAGLYSSKEGCRNQVTGERDLIAKANRSVELAN